MNSAKVFSKMDLRWVELHPDSRALTTFSAHSEETCQRLKECGVTLNKEKCIFSVSELVFFGFKVSADGLSPDVEKESQ